MIIKQDEMCGSIREQGKRLISELCNHLTRLNEEAKGCECPLLVKDRTTETENVGYIGFEQVLVGLNSQLYLFVYILFHVCAFKPKNLSPKLNKLNLSKGTQDNNAP